MTCTWLKIHTAHGSPHFTSTAVSSSGAVLMWLLKQIKRNCHHSKTNAALCQMNSHICETRSCLESLQLHDRVDDFYKFVQGKNCAHLSSSKAAHSIWRWRAIRIYPSSLIWIFIECCGIICQWWWSIIWSGSAQQVRPSHRPCGVLQNVLCSLVHCTTNIAMHITESNRPFIIITKKLYAPFPLDYSSA